jgi:hypothetical protein
MLPLILIAVVAGGVPNYDVAKGCKAEAAVEQDANAYKGCVDDEMAAKAKLQQEWAKYPAADRRDCASAQDGDVSKSYVELMTCFQMQDWKKNLGKTDADATDQPAPKFSGLGGRKPLHPQQ